MLKNLQALLQRSRGVLGMNRRNLEFIYPCNQRRDFPVADDKLRTKELLRPHGVAMPETYRVFGHFFELSRLEELLAPYAEFVVKPAMGSGGGGILVVTGRSGRDFIAIDGKIITPDALRDHIANIIFGVYSLDMHDKAIIESRVVQHAGMNELSPFGLADIRVILHEDRPVLAMTRLPTRASQGRANIHQGAVGAGIDLASGAITHAVWRGRPIATHPDLGISLLGRIIPMWLDVMPLAKKIAALVPLKYLGVDISLGCDQPLLLEINVRPGLQIQCANQQGLIALLNGVDAR